MLADQVVERLASISKIVKSGPAMKYLYLSSNKIQIKILGAPWQMVQMDQVPDRSSKQFQVSRLNHKVYKSQAVSIEEALNLLTTSMYICTNLEQAGYEPRLPGANHPEPRSSHSP